MESTWASRRTLKYKELITVGEGNYNSIKKHTLTYKELITVVEGKYININ